MRLIISLKKYIRKNTLEATLLGKHKYFNHHLTDYSIQAVLKDTSQKRYGTF